MPDDTNDNPRGQGDEMRGRPRRRPRVAQRGSGEQSFVPVALKLSPVYLELLEAEASLVGVARGVFLTLLVRRRRGLVELGRGRNAPKPARLVVDEVQAAKPFRWMMTRAERALLDADRAAIGRPDLSWYATLLLNDWLGEPYGLRPTKRGPA